MHFSPENTFTGKVKCGNLTLYAHCNNCNTIKMKKTDGSCRKANKQGKSVSGILKVNMVTPHKKLMEGVTKSRCNEK